MRLCGLLSLITAVAGHGSMIMPPSRNAIDASPGMPWANGKHPPTGVIEPYTCSCSNGTEPCSSAQGCFWFSQGVSVGCSRADGNGTRIPNLDHCPAERAAGFDPLTMEGALLPKYRTVNLHSVPGSPSDIWKYNPWRAPGKGPTADPCGMAGGNTVGVFNAGEYNATAFAKQGDLGTHVLRKRTDIGETVWKRGDVERARWEITAAHGGGYVYQLCPASQPLTEECFASTPLPFATAADGSYTQRFIHSDSSDDFDAPATLVTEGGGVGWAINPYPYGTSIPCDWNAAAHNQHCSFQCARCGAPWYAADGACPDHNCEHAIAEQALPNITYGTAIPDRSRGANTVEDRVRVPTSLAAGEYVLRWRWDCEASSQVWTTCSDITIA